MTMTSKTTSQKISQITTTMKRCTLARLLQLSRQCTWPIRTRTRRIPATPHFHTRQMHTLSHPPNCQAACTYPSGPKWPFRSHGDRQRPKSVEGWRGAHEVRSRAFGVDHMLNTAVGGPSSKPLRITPPWLFIQCMKESRYEAEAPPATVAQASGARHGPSCD